MKISIITVSYNSSLTITRTIESVLSQKNVDLEYVIVDGASKDGTVDIIRQYAEKNPCIKWISEKDNGIYDAMNKGVKIATGDWIYFLGCDDYLYPAFSEMCCLLKEKHTIYYGNVFHRGRVQDGAFTAYKLSKYPIPHQAILYPRMVFERYSYDLRYKISADHYLTIQCWHDKDIRFKYCDLVLARYTEGGFSTQGDALFQKEKPQIIRRNFNFWVYLRYRYRLYKYRNKVQWYDKTIE